MTTKTEEMMDKLAHLLKSANNKKILMEEMRLVSEKAFALQENILSELDKQEAKETDIAAIQQIFDTREQVWDIINKIALKEMEIKEKTFSKETYQNRNPDTSDPADEHEDCCCSKHAKSHCCHHKNTDQHASDCCGHCCNESHDQKHIH